MAKRSKRKLPDPKKVAAEVVAEFRRCVEAGGDPERCMVMAKDKVGAKYGVDLDFGKKFDRTIGRVKTE